MQQGVKEKARALLENGTVSRVLGWKKGEFCYDLTPAVFASPEEVDRNFVYSDFSGASLSKYLITESKKEGKIAAFLKPCDGVQNGRMVVLGVSKDMALLSTIPLIMTHGRNGSVRKRRMKKEKIRSRRIVMMKNPTERKEMVLHLRK